MMVDGHGNVSEEPADGKQLCNLAEGYSFVLQSVLGVLAFSTLIRESSVAVPGIAHLSYSVYV